MSMRVEGARDDKARGAWMARDAELRGGARTRRDMEVAEREGAWVRGTRDAGRGTRDAGRGGRRGHHAIPDIRHPLREPTTRRPPTLRSHQPVSRRESD